jgi:hypothetical protein
MSTPKRGLPSVDAVLRTALAAARPSHEVTTGFASHAALRAAITPAGRGRGAKAKDAATASDIALLERPARRTYNPFARPRERLNGARKCRSICSSPASA